jgi:hypothetical protein
LYSRLSIAALAVRAIQVPVATRMTRRIRMKNREFDNMPLLSDDLSASTETLIR